jgi:two-component system, chemotaxis family, chemotaxis protein CheY
MRGMHILVVDDEALSRRVLTKLIAPLGTYDVAVGGGEALELFLISCEKGYPYHLILLDIRMPKKSGVDTLIEIRRAERHFGLEGLKKTKIIMTSTAENLEYMQKSFEEQCDAYLVKPISLQKLDETLKRLKIIF